MNREGRSRLARRVAFVLVVVPLATWQALSLSPKPLLVNRASGSHAVYDRRGDLLRLSLSSDEKYRLWVPLDQLPASLIEATLAQEDRHFFHHPGVNPFALVRGAFETYVRRGRRVGGSTLTMQLARLRFGIDSRHVGGKLLQILRAMQLEAHFTKEQILEAYFNLAPYGGNIEGAGAASLIYFRKPVSQLDRRQTLTLSVIPKSPAARRPGSRNGEKAIACAREQAASLLPNARSLSLDTDFDNRRSLPYRAPHFVQRVLEQPSIEGRIDTTLDGRLQATIESQVKLFVERNRRLGIENASVLLVAYESMEARAYIGSADFFGEAIDGQFDGIRAQRSPGSALKPFVYALALDQGLINPLTMLKDTSLTISAYNPENFDRDFLGPIHATDALVRSRYLPAIQLANQLRDPDLYGFLKRAGIEDLRGRNVYGLALALGGGEIRIDELAQLYAMLANGGEWQAMKLVPSEHHTPGKRLLSPEASFLVLDMLRHNPRPGEAEASARLDDRSRIPWKTGTSYGFRDAWAAGVIGPYVLVTWVGNFDGRSNPAFVGRDTAGPLFFAIVDALRADQPLEERTVSKVRLVLREVCALSGQIPGPHCPHRRSTWVIPGKTSIETCQIHRSVAIDTATGLRACADQLQGVRNEIYEFWPSDLLSLFRSAGIERRVPPPFAPRCSTDTPHGRAPLIASPQATVEYALHGDKQIEIPFSAVTDSDSRRVYWFLDDTFAGDSASGATFFWPARPGTFQIRAVDEHGRSVHTHLRVVQLADS